MRLLYLTSIDGFVVFGLYRCTSELNFLFDSTFVAPKWAVEPDLLTLINEQEKL